MAYVYRHIRLDKKEPFYIGIGNDSDGKYSRANRKTYRSELWTRIITKTEYRVEILEDDLTWEEAQEKEMWWIRFYGRIDLKTGPLANLTDGGDGMVGWKPTQETLDLLSSVRKGRVFLPKGWKMSEEQRNKMSKARMGKEPWIKGKKMSEEQRKKVSEAMKGCISEKRKPVICIETGEIFPSIEHAEKDPRFYIGGVGKVLRGLRKHLKGFHFEYYTPPSNEGGEDGVVFLGKVGKAIIP